MKLFISLILSASVLFSCTKVIELDENYQAPKNVMNCIFDVDADSIELFLTRSKEIYGFDKNFEKVEDAEVILMKEESRIATLSYTPGNDIGFNYDNLDFGSRYLVQSLDLDTAANYTLQSVHPQYGFCYGQTQVPTRVKIDSIRLAFEEIMIWGWLEEVMVAYVSFTDPAGEDNYYRICDAYVLTGKTYTQYVEVDGQWLDVPSDSIYVSRSSYPRYDQVDPVICPNEDDIFNYVENYHQTFNDELIEGKGYQMKYIVKYGSEESFFDVDTASGEFFEIGLELQSIPKDLFLYYTTLDAFRWNDGEFFMEPVQTRSNIENGLGIVAAYRKDVGIINYGRQDRDDVDYVYANNDYYNYY